jgi:hypothetical protein
MLELERLHLGTAWEIVAVCLDGEAVKYSVKDGDVCGRLTAAKEIRIKYKK